MNLTVCEIFKSIQGESSFAGLPFTIVRLTGCNLRCSYCDTQYAWTEGDQISVGDTALAVERLGMKHVLVTGGEPLLQPSALQLIERLLVEQRIVLVETNGSMDISVLPEKAISIMDIKCPGSGQSHMMDWNNLERLRRDDQVKFVLTDRRDYDWAVEICRKFLIGSCDEILMSAAFGMLSPRELAAWMLSDKLEVRLQLQLHKHIWPGELRGV
ncbi:MAG: radical SAM protein [Deltaproteobacteria bacterium]|nr:radical SAM protein [Deltaproteobacteria bacterium]